MKMTPFLARIIFASLTGLFAFIIINATYLQSKTHKHASQRHAYTTPANAAYETNKSQNITPAQTREKSQTALQTVKSVQAFLAEMGYAPGEVDGVLRASTVAAIKKFQTDRTMQADGRISKKLIDEIWRVTGRAIPYTHNYNNAG
jgi:peptidoglycan hydrolase-like protein with peptidoglycan-binding domain